MEISLYVPPYLASLCLDELFSPYDISLFDFIPLDPGRMRFGVFYYTFFTYYALPDTNIETFSPPLMGLSYESIRRSSHLIGALLEAVIRSTR